MKVSSLFYIHDDINRISPPRRSPSILSAEEVVVNDSLRCCVLTTMAISGKVIFPVFFVYALCYTISCCLPNACDMYYGTGECTQVGRECTRHVLRYR